ncbi:TetR/AcrR family transcriptional regulator [Flexibacterium corallicola]|uniref:TetR/AcrR family transcriptional regulator n=1 Tax=Flexibacterium corallicola TaxID=3037259 RepID=UPI00286F9C59|nr:TetR/AcrR family transcriptional regulator [Pseudovibrio sp. M1P-2-3]
MDAKTQPQKSAYHHGDLRTALLDEAATMLKEGGEAGLSMRKLAANVDVSRTAAYHYFSDKQGLLCAIAEEGFAKFMAATNTREETQGDTVSEDTIYTFAKNYVDFATNNPEYYDLMFGGTLWKSKTLTESLQKAAHQSFRQYVTRVSHWRKLGLISKDVDPLRYAQVSWGTLHGISRLTIDGIYIDRKALDAMCRNMAHIFYQQLEI